MQIKWINSQETNDNQFDFSEHGAYLCAHHNSAQLFQRSDVAHVISVQPHEVKCFMAIEDKENKHWKWKENEVDT